MALNYGKDAKLTLGTSEMKVRQWSLRSDSQMHDATNLGDDWSMPVPVLQDWQVTIEASYDPSETNGQLVVENAKLSGTKITNLMLYYNASNYWTPDTTTDTNAGAYVSRLENPTVRAGVSIVTFTITGHGPLKRA